MSFQYGGTPKVDLLNNVRSEKKNTKRSSNTLLRLVFFFSERTLDPS